MSEEKNEVPSAEAMLALMIERMKALPLPTYYCDDAIALAEKVLNRRSPPSPSVRKKDPRKPKSIALLLSATRKLMQDGDFRPPMGAVARLAGRSIRTCFELFGSDEEMWQAALADAETCKIIAEKIGSYTGRDLCTVVCLGRLPGKPRLRKTNGRAILRANQKLIAAAKARQALRAPEELDEAPSPADHDAIGTAAAWPPYPL